MKKCIKISPFLGLLLVSIEAISQSCYTCSTNTPTSTLKASAFNFNSFATGSYSFTAGNNTRSSGESSTSFGSYTTASGLCSFAIGYNSTASGNYGISIGNTANAYGLASVSIGFGSQAFNHSFAIGEYSLAGGESSISLGHYVTAGVSGAMVIGNSTSDNVLVNNKSHSLMIGFSSSPIFFANATKIGIATSTPRSTFDVNGTSYFYDAVNMASLMTPKGTKGVVVSDENGLLSFIQDWHEIPGDNLGNHVAEMDLDLGGNYIYNGTKESIGRIGLTLTPENNAILTNGNETSFNISSGTSQRSSLWLTNYQTGGVGFMLNSDNLSGGIFYDQTNPKPVISFTSDKVGIGIEPVETSHYSLFVKGGIITEELLIKLESSGWYDEVFNEDYKLPSLIEVEKYIKANHHLQDIPSAEEVGTDGVKIGEFNALLLKKIEELTLYVIEQQKKIDALQEKVNNLN